MMVDAELKPNIGSTVSPNASPMQPRETLAWWISQRLGDPIEFNCDTLTFRTSSFGKGCLNHIHRELWIEARRSTQESQEANYIRK